MARATQQARADDVAGYSTGVLNEWLSAAWLCSRTGRRHSASTQQHNQTFQAPRFPPSVCPVFKLFVHFEQSVSFSLVSKLIVMAYIRPSSFFSLVILISTTLVGCGGHTWFFFFNVYIVRFFFSQLKLNFSQVWLFLSQCWPVSHSCQIFFPNLTILRFLFLYFSHNSGFSQLWQEVKKKFLLHISQFWLYISRLRQKSHNSDILIRTYVWLSHYSEYYRCEILSHNCEGENSHNVSFFSCGGKGLPYGGWC